MVLVAIGMRLLLDANRIFGDWGVVCACRQERRRPLVLAAGNCVAWARPCVRHGILCDRLDEDHPVTRDAAVDDGDSLTGRLLANIAGEVFQGVARLGEDQSLRRCPVASSTIGGLSGFH